MRRDRLTAKILFLYYDGKRAVLATPMMERKHVVTTSQVVFDPFSDDFFTDPYQTYRRMRDDAPVYYSEQYDFYALTRHADVSEAFKDFETPHPVGSTCRWCSPTTRCRR